MKNTMGKYEKLDSYKFKKTIDMHRKQTYNTSISSYQMKEYLKITNKKL